MKFTEISNYDVRPGRLTEWTATVASPEVGWASDPRPPSHVQEAHVRDALVRHTAGRPVPTWLATAFELPGPLDPTALRAALLRWIDRHETLRSALSFDRNGRLCRSTLPAGGVALHHTDRGELGRGDAVAAHVADLFDRVTDPLGWPSYAVVTVDRTDSTTIYLGLDHANVDGYSILLIPNEIRALYLAARDGAAPCLREVGSYLEFAHRERAETESVGPDSPVVARWRRVLDAGGQLPGFPLDVGAGPAALVPQRGTCTWLLDAAQAESFGAACTKAGGSFLAGVLACLGIAGHEVSGAGEFRALAPFSTRDGAEWVDSLGWYIGLAPVEFPIGGAGNFHQLARTARAAAREARPVARVPVARVGELLGAPLRPRFVVSYMDMRHTPGAQGWREWRTCAFHSRAAAADEVYLWIHRGPEGVYLTCRHPDTGAGRRNVTRYLGHLRRVIDEIAAQGTYAIPERPTLPAGDIAPTR
ncbi:condensation domain-containing protein [Amycolatopsis arida]|nr:condensation domain-containing protein [Amycolatopsis arida]